MSANTDTYQNRWLTEKQVAALTGISCSSLQKQRHKGIGFPYVKFGLRLVRYSEVEVHKHMCAHQVSTDN